MPDWTVHLRVRLAGLRLTPTREAEIVEEWSQHLDERYDELRAGGAGDEQALTITLAELREPGTVGGHGRTVRRARLPVTAQAAGGAAGSSIGLPALPAEIARAVRVHRRNLPTAAAVLVTLAVGIGAGTSIFSVVHALFLRPLPYGDADRLVMVWEDASARGAGLEDVAGANFLDWRVQNTAFDEMAAARNITRTFTDLPEPLSPLAHAVTANYFRVMGVQPVLGRTFAPGEDAAPGAPVAMLAYSTWQSLFGADPGAIGRTVALDGVPHEIIGVVPPSFYSANYFAAQPAVWVPLPIDTFREERGIRRFLVFARLKGGVTDEQAQADISRVARELAARFPNTNDRWSARVVPIRDQLVGRVERPLAMIVLAAGALMCIAAFNVVCLLLASGTARLKGMAARRALGAPGRQIVRQLLVEAGILAVVGAGLGLLLSAPTTRYIIALVPQQSLAPIPFLDQVGTNPAVAAFAVGCALIIAIGCGLATARQALCADVVSELVRNAGRSTSEGRIEQRLRQGLVVAQVALSVMLLLAAGLMARSLRNLLTTPLGFEPANTMTIRASVRGPNYANPDAPVRFFNEVVDRIAALPGVASASLASMVPPVSMFSSTVFSVGDVDARIEAGSAAFIRVGAGYFDTLGIPVIAGRAATAFDTAGSQPVTIIGRELARRYFADGDPIGRTMTVEEAGRKTRRLVIGVAGDVRSASPDPRPQPVIHVPHAQAPLLDMALVVRLEDGRPLPVTDIRRIVASIDRTAPLFDAQTLERAVTEADGMARFVTLLLGVFTVVGLALVAAGLYGALAFVVAMRQREIGVRLALGARFAQIARIVLGFAASVVAVGAVAGILGFFVLGGLFESLLFGVTRSDPATLAGVVGILATVTGGRVRLASPARPAGQPPDRDEKRLVVRRSQIGTGRSDVAASEIAVEGCRWWWCIG